MRWIAILLALAVSACARPTTPPPVLDQASIDAETERQMALSWKDEWNLKNRFWSVAFRVMKPAFRASAP
ncbi:hypothetical protein [Magnetospirillum sp. SS-4]|uniref:hypothetical protein n=1 Tax=Magnetospirillum sp. SS-4 TaxID=2681465 RepID=UPI001573D28C|nr:hypothetical protein [Magnetospirillum sp. SS-4]